MSSTSVQLIRLDGGWQMAVHGAVAHWERRRRYRATMEEERPLGGQVMGREAELLGR
jgi:hypothetical protein